MNQDEFRLPAPGEGWRHYKTSSHSLYTIIGLAHHEETGEPLVVYTRYNWGDGQLPPLFVRPLSAFLGVVEVGPDPRNPDGPARRVPRFSFERSAGDDPGCPYLPRTPEAGVLRQHLATALDHI